MIRRHIVGFGLTILFLMGALIAVLMWWAGNYSTTVATAMLILVLLGTAAGTLIPNILLTWLIIVLSTIGIAILMMGYVVMTIPIKIGLLLAFPVCASLSTLSRSILSGWRWIDRNRAEVNSYAEHYDQITKLQTKYNAQKIYKKAQRFVMEDQDDSRWLNTTAIHWSHNRQIRQFHKRAYNEMLREFAKVLKTDRLPSESLYYIGCGTFLIISFNLTKQTYDHRNALTRQDLQQLKIGQATPQFKWGTKYINKDNAARFPELKEIIRHIDRDMETDLIVEYMKGDNANG
ncbi:MFS transporter [Limosilactobacillus viscerum]|uniref:hypothetical protein n=1 Tax=Limosilactobacillus viscerum TaxID=2993450 RepID=UPI0024BB6B5D|nr:hypothetical protein [Limosilactobacillus viscerum]